MTNGSPQRVRLTTATESGEQYRIQLPRSHSFLDDGALGTATAHQCRITSPTTAVLLLLSRFSHVHVHAQQCLTHCGPMDSSPAGSSVHGIFLARILKWVCHILLQRIFLIQGLNPCLLHLWDWQVDSLPLHTSIQSLSHV